MLRNRILLRAFATFFMLEIFTSTVLPTLSYALTSGPTAPEATSFEPVDTTDMVNLSTGDLVYNIPLLEVPGPSGGYPLSLSYHAGIMPNEEASWVGLGWTLNPGAISRNVNGFADDHSNVTNTDRFFWEGGNRHTLEVGVTLGISGVAGASAGLAFSQDTYQGFGVGAFIGVGVGLSGNSSIGINARLGVDAYGSPYASAGIGVGIGNSEKSAVSIGVGVGVSTNFESVSAYAGGGVSVGYKKPDHHSKTGLQAGSASLLGASISSGKNGVSTSVSVAGASGVHNSKTEKVSTSSWGFTLPLPFINLGYNYQRYWIDETANINVFGALYNPTNKVTSGFDHKAYDSYTLLDPEVNVADNPDPDKVLGGSFLNYDQYYVNAQGLGGHIRPYSFKNLIFRQNRKKSNSYEVKQYPYYDGYRNEPFEFRFIGDLSNKYLNTGGSIAAGSPPLIPLFGFSEKTGEAANQGDGIRNGHLVGSRHIEWYTNKQIKKLDNTKNPELEGFIDSKATGFVRSTAGSLGDQIGGFKITNESGVTYHFALPAYAFKDYQYSENIRKPQGHTFNELTKTEPYAYTWYLTAVTGPDYVDRGPTGAPNGILDEYDWGYWIELEYGKWTDFYAWRNPSEGMTPDLDNDFKNFSEGIKELYYLDAIRTKTHTALFVKSIRHDAKSASYSYRNKTAVYDNVKAQITTYTKEGGFVPRNISNFCNDLFADEGTVSYVSRPTSTLKLESIYLLSNSDLNTVTFQKSTGNQYYQTYNYPWNVTLDDPLSNNCDFSPISFVHHLPQFVLDVNDIESVKNQLKERSLRIIDLKTDYELVPETSNSFDYALVNTENPSTLKSDYPLYGKLTLKTLSFLGKGGSDLIPPTRFYYDVTDPIGGNTYLYQQPGSAANEYIINQTNSGLTDGDLVKIFSGNRTCYGLVYEASGGINKVRIVGTQMPFTNQYATWIKTKNPPYNKDFVDSWGMYKSDYQSESGVTNESLRRAVSQRSSKSTDVWSLRKINSSTGASIVINYDSDKYSNVEMSTEQILRIKNVVNLGNNLIELFFHEEVDLTHLFEGIEFFTTVMVGYELYGNRVAVRTSDGCNSTQMLSNYAMYVPAFYSEASFIHTINATSVVIEDQFLTTKITEPKTLIRKFPSSCSGQVVRTEIDIVGWPEYMSGGVVSFPKVVQKYGGGLVVKSILVENGLNKSATTYKYFNGSTSYEPYGFLPVALADGLPSEWYNDDNVNRNIKREVTKLYKPQLANARELPPPGVLYHYVEINEEVNEKPVPNRTLYQFEQFKSDDIGIVILNDNENPISSTYDNITYSRIKRRDVVIKDMTSKAGLLKQILLLDEQGNKISETVNQYLHDNIEGSSLIDRANDYDNKFNDFKSQGVIQETLMDGRFIKEQDDNTYSLFGVTSRRHYYPVLLTGQTVTNYKTGIVTQTENLAFDFYSGQVTRTLSSDGYGNHYIAETQPAYRVPEYQAMGFTASGGKNMLTQEASAYTYKVEPSNANQPISNSNYTPVGLVAASIQTWSDQLPVVEPGVNTSQFLYQPGIWRKHESYSFIGDVNAVSSGDGLHLLTNNQLPAFNSWQHNRYQVKAVPEGWQRNAEMTLFDVYSHALEVKDLNNQFASTKMSIDNTRVIATAANAEYREFAYSGAEDVVDNNSLVGGGVYINGIPGTIAHTGKKGVRATAGNKAFTYYMVPKQRTYEVSVWANQNDANIKYRLNSGAPVTCTVKKVGKSGIWNLLQTTIPITQAWDNLEIWCEAKTVETHFDDFRIKPLDAAMTSYVYNEWGELSHILDNNNLYTHFVYDGMGRLKETYKETFVNEGQAFAHATYGNQGIVKVSEIAYNYGSNSPYTVNITATVTGPSGQIVPQGVQSVVQGKDATFEIRETCANPRLELVTINNQIINLNLPQVTLYDGTVVQINGRVLTFKKVQGHHTINAKFYQSFGGVARCFTYEDGNCICYDGSYEYGYYNECGQLGPMTRVWNADQIPPDLVAQIPVQPCASFNTPGCQCQIGFQN